MANHQDLRKSELQYLAGEFLKDQSLFELSSFVDDSAFLQPFGIYIPGKEEFPEGYIKFLPQDFIVEEIGQDGTVETVSPEDNAFEKSEEGETVYATLVKCNLSTLEAIDEISAQSKIPKDKIQYAGIKDKDAITSQLISFRKVPIEDVKKVSSPYFFLKNIRKGKGIVEKGKLSGNRFTIFIRTKKDFKDEDIKRFIGQIKKIQENGFYNFFYLQRFSTPRLKNFRWGYQILKGNYEEAVREVLVEPGLREYGFFTKLRSELSLVFGDWGKIKEKIAPLPLHFRDENAIVEHLSANPRDFKGALLKIPDQITLWIYGLSSLLFNQQISDFLSKGEEPPELLPVFLSTLRDNWEYYSKDLKTLGIYPPPFSNLRPFRSIKFRDKPLQTKDHALIHKAEPIDGGIVFQFSLGKGEYATTFLSHFFNIASGKPDPSLFSQKIDPKKIIGEDGLEKTLGRFSSVITDKPTNFEDLLKNIK